MTDDDINKKLDNTQQQLEHEIQMSFGIINENKNLKLYLGMFQQEIQDRGNRIEELEKVLRAINEWWDTDGAHALPFEPPWHKDMLKALRLEG
jgi:hypothetical protein